MAAITHSVEALTFPRTRATDALEDAFAAILENVDENPEREGLMETPKRAAKAMRFLTQGYSQSLDEIVNGALFSSDNEDMVTVRNIEFYSLCEHHMLPFIGRCHIAYLPRGTVLGLSKLARIVDFHARRLQIQENLTKQIATTMDDILAPQGVAVHMSAVHLCMMMRGVEKQSSDTTTTSFLGAFRESSELRMEFNQQVSSAASGTARF